VRHGFVSTSRNDCLTTTAESRHLVVSDLLCYVINKFARVPLKPLKSVVNDFYSADDICNAKDKLVDEVDKLALDKWQKPARRRKDSITRTQNEIDDIIQIVTMLDETLNLHRLPTFVSTDPDCMPSIKLTDGDLAVVLLKLNALELNVNELREGIRVQQPTKSLPGGISSGHVSFTSRPSNVSKHGGNAAAPSTVQDGYSSAQLVSCDQMSTDADETSDNDGYVVKKSRKRKKDSMSPKLSAAPSSHSSSSQPLYSSRAAIPGPNQRNPGSKPKPKTVIGASSNSSIKASKTLIVKKSVFRLGNIDCAYATTDIETYIRSLGVRILTCFELRQSSSQPSDNKSFRICVVAEDRIKLCDSENWSVGVSIRDWVHKPKNDSGQSHPESVEMREMVGPNTASNYLSSVAGTSVANESNIVIHST
jgi:hypothetical protein